MSFLLLSSLTVPLQEAKPYSSLKGTQARPESEPWKEIVSSGWFEAFFAVVIAPRFKLQGLGFRVQALLVWGKQGLGYCILEKQGSIMRGLRGVSKVRSMGPQYGPLP